MKIQQETIYNVLSSDATLSNLLSATDTNSKIFSTIPDNSEDFPCIAYSVFDSETRIIPNRVQDIVLEFRIYGANKTICENIFDRLWELLNYRQDWNNHIVYIKQTGETDIPEEDRSLWSKIVQFQVWGSN